MYQISMVLARETFSQRTLGSENDIEWGCMLAIVLAKCKTANPIKKGASGKMSYYTPIAAQSRTHAQVLDQAKEYQSASSLAAAREIQKRNGFHYSELVRLPYFDMVRMLITGPMHTFILEWFRMKLSYALKAYLMTSLLNLVDA